MSAPVSLRQQRQHLMQACGILSEREPALGVLLLMACVYKQSYRIRAETCRNSGNVVKGMCGSAPAPETGHLSLSPHPPLLIAALTDGNSMGGTLRPAGRVLSQ